MKIIRKLITLVFIASISLINIINANAVQEQDYTYLYIDKGNVEIGDGFVSGFSAYGEKITTVNEAGYCITSTTLQNVSNTITINGGSHNIIIKNINISISSQFDCAFSVSNYSILNLTLEGENNLKSGASRAGLEISANSTVVIGGEGGLYAQSAGQAGIGGGNGASNGTLVINSGNITAKCTNNSAGIGGGSSGSGGNITINGGNVTAYGGDTAAGIGGGCASDGGSITINGGTITAVGGSYGAGIGGGWYGLMGSIKINGGSVKATGGENAPSIGAGSGLTSENVINSSGERLYLAIINAEDFDEIEEIYTSGKANNLSSFHQDDTNFYFYIPGKTVVFSLKSASLLTVYYKAAFNQGFTCQKVEPIHTKGTAFIRADDIISGITFGLSNLDDYLTISNDFSLSYDNELIGTGTKVNLIYDGEIVYSYKALLYGDLNGDGFYDAEDSFMTLLMLWDKLNAENTDLLLFEAADVNFNGFVDQEDMEILQRAGLLLESVAQNEIIQTDSAEQLESLELTFKDEAEQKEEGDEKSQTLIVKFLKDILKATPALPLKIRL